MSNCPQWFSVLPWDRRGSNTLSSSLEQCQDREWTKERQNTHTFLATQKTNFLKRHTQLWDTTQVLVGQRASADPEPLWLQLWS